MNKKTVVIIGGGIAGIAAVKKLQKHSSKIDIILIEKQKYHILKPSIHLIAANKEKESHVQIDFEDIINLEKVKLIQGSVSNVDYSEQAIKYDDLNSKKTETIKYDYLILAKGNTTNYFGNFEKYGKYTMPLSSLEEAVGIRTEIKNILNKATKEKSEAKRRELLTFTIIGGGATGVELASDLSEQFYRELVDNNIDPDEFTLNLMTGTDEILSALSKGLQNKAQKYLENKLKVNVYLSAKVNEVKEKQVLYTKKGKDLTLKSNLIIWVAGVMAPNCEVEKITKDVCERIVTNGNLQTKEYSNVFVAGDELCYKYKNQKWPQMVVPSEITGHTAAINVINSIENKKLKIAKPNILMSSYNVSLGSMYSVNNLMGIKFGGKIARTMKSAIDYYYFFTVGKIKLCSKYFFKNK